MITTIVGNVTSSISGNVIPLNDNIAPFDIHDLVSWVVFDNAKIQRKDNGLILATLTNDDKHSRFILHYESGDTLKFSYMYGDMFEQFRSALKNLNAIYS